MNTDDQQPPGFGHGLIGRMTTFGAEPTGGAQEDQGGQGAPVGDDENAAPVAAEES
ncbi:hypothetical protein BKA00_005823 [Actinomadura coerulea]|uniref:Uncharacterized protein n=1 Tax=Actinomadura coerulea TaxID=46159 RepID=A0A7X0G450_9ACTN|nr:hypothetical protein [Actinomadura coerulea]MBB6398909.1 hypothetical protein [Actinomadura coerulea]GGP98330.1 hypothetical protein GCM10010187_12430 [Actinomadura coerulea]